MLKYFWTYETDLPTDIGVETFGVVHLTWVAIVLFIIFLTIQIYRKQPAVKRRRIQVAAAFLLITGYIVRWIWAGLIGHYSIVEMLPLHLCTISVIVEFAAVISGRIIFKEFAYCCSLPGAISSLITPLEVFELWFGNPGYLIPTILLLLIIWFLFYIPWFILIKKEGILLNYFRRSSKKYVIKISRRGSWRFPGVFL